MKTFAVFLRMKDAEKSKEFRPAHLAFLEQCESEGAIMAKGTFVDGAGGLVIFKGESLEQVEALVKQDPFIIEGAREYEIHEWKVIFVQ